MGLFYNVEKCVLVIAAMKRTLEILLHVFRCRRYDADMSRRVLFLQHQCPISRGLNFVSLLFEFGPVSSHVVCSKKIIRRF